MNLFQNFLYTLFWTYLNVTIAETDDFYNNCTMLCHTHSFVHSFYWIWTSQHPFFVVTIICGVVDFIIHPTDVAFATPLITATTRNCQCHNQPHYYGSNHTIHTIVFVHAITVIDKNNIHKSIWQQDLVQTSVYLGTVQCLQQQHQNMDDHIHNTTVQTFARSKLSRQKTSVPYSSVLFALTTLQGGTCSLLSLLPCMVPWFHSYLPPG